MAGFVYLGEDRTHGVWGVYRSEADEISFRATDSSGWDGENRRARAGRRPEPSPNDWTMAKHIAKAAEPLSALDAAALANHLGLPVEALAALPIRVLPNDTYNRWAWVFPEYDGTGRLACHVLRYPDGRKIAHGPRGLTIPSGFDRMTGPVFLPEGASDVLALCALGIACVGRPNSGGGVQQLARFLADLPTDREIVVLGENDQKPDGKWPGREGAERIAAALARELNRPVLIAFPPAGTKDIRAWLCDQGHWGGARDTFLAAVMPFARSVGPPRPAEASKPTQPSVASGTVTRIVQLQAQEQAIAERVAREIADMRRHSFACSNPYRIILEGKTDGCPYLLDRRCESWTCPGCAHLHKEEWKANVGLRLLHRIHPEVHTGVIDPAAWGTISRQFRREGQPYFRMAYGDMLLVVAVAPFPGSSPTRLAEAANRLCNALDSYHGSRRPIAASRSWSLCRITRDAKEPSKFVRKGYVKRGTSEHTIGEILAAVHVTPQELQVPPSQEDRVLRFRRLVRNGWTAGLKEHLYECLSVGEALPFVRLTEVDEDGESGGAAHRSGRPGAFVVNLSSG